MNSKLDYRKIGLAIAGIFAIIFGLMRGSDLFPMPEKPSDSIHQSASDETLQTKQNEVDTTKTLNRQNVESADSTAE